MARVLPTPSELRKLLDYDPATGVLTWRVRPVEMFPDLRACRSWNSRYSVKPAGCINALGYSLIGINYHRLLGHRVAWAIHHGRWPEDQIDHINLIRGDNRIANLREADNALNSRNRTLHKCNTSGVAGVSWDRSRGLWQAYINNNTGRISLGRFDDMRAAIAVRLEAEEKYGYTQNNKRKCT